MEVIGEPRPTLTGTDSRQQPAQLMPAAATLLAAAAAAGNAWAGRRRQMPAVRLWSIRGDWLSVQASPLHGPGGLSIILVLEEPDPGNAASLILHSHGATGAQAKVVALVLRGT
jgi:hypothetical protein